MVALEDALKVERVEACHYKAVLHPALCFRNIAHGGSLLTLVQLALEEAFKHDFKRASQPHLLDLHSSILRPTMTGEVTIKITEAKLGPLASTVFFNLSQKSKINVTGFATHTNFTTPHPTLLLFPFKNKNHFPSPKIPNFALLDSNAEPNWTRVEFFPEPDLPLKAIPQLNWYFPTPNYTPTQSDAPPRDPNVSDFWISPLKPEQKFYTSHMSFLADMPARIPEALRPGHESSDYTHEAFVIRGMKQRQGRGDEIKPLKLAPVAYPTLSLSVEIKRPVPDDGVRWLYVRATMQGLVDGKWDMEVVICDVDMQVVAVCRLLSLIVDLDVAMELAKKAAAAAAAAKAKGKPKRRDGKL